MAATAEGLLSLREFLIILVIIINHYYLSLTITFSIVISSLL